MQEQCADGIQHAADPRQPHTNASSELPHRDDKVGHQGHAQNSNITTEREAKPMVLMIISSSATGSKILETGERQSIFTTQAMLNSVASPRFFLSLTDIEDHEKKDMIQVVAAMSERSSIPAQKLVHNVSYTSP